MSTAKAALRNRKVWTLTVCIVLAVAGMVCWSATRCQLSSFIDRDLRKLDPNPVPQWRKLLAKVVPDDYLSSEARLKKTLGQVLPEEFTRPPFWGGGLEPWYLWRHTTKTGERFVLFQADTYFPSPGSARVVVHFLDSSGRHLTASDFRVGWRTQLVEAVFADQELLGTKAIVIRTEQTLGGYDSRQYYTLRDNRLALVRFEDLDQGMRRNYYYDGLRPGVGPEVLPRNADEWETLLLSTEPCDILEALMWIGGDHRNLEHKSDPLVDAIRARPTVRTRIAELSESPNAWIREAAIQIARESKK